MAHAALLDDSSWKVQGSKPSPNNDSPSKSPINRLIEFYIAFIKDFLGFNLWFLTEMFLNKKSKKFYFDSKSDPSERSRVRVPQPINFFREPDDLKLFSRKKLKKWSKIALTLLPGQ